MDFTNNPEANMFPDESLFLFLQDLYGTVPPGRRSLNRVLLQSSIPSTTIIPRQIHPRIDDTMLSLQKEYVDGNLGGNRALQAERRDAYAFSLADGWTLQVQIQFVDENA